MATDSKKIFSVISENTLTPISLVLVICAGVFWLASLYSQVQRNTTRLDAVDRVIETKLDKQMAVQMEMQRTLSRLEGQVSIIVDEKKKR